MDRREWHLSDDPAAMLAWVTIRGAVGWTRPRASDRKLRQWVEACRSTLVEREGVLTVWRDLDRYPEELSECITTWSGKDSTRYQKLFPLADRAALLREIIGDPWEPVSLCPSYYETRPGGTKVHIFECPDPDEGYHSPNCPLSSATVLGIARRIDDTQDWDAMPILADALEDAGCSCEPLLMHLRGWEVCPYCMGTGGFQANSTWVPCEACDPDDKPSDTIGWRPLRTPHCRGCWALELLLGQS